MKRRCNCYICFFFNDTATTEIYTLSLHDALPISAPGAGAKFQLLWPAGEPVAQPVAAPAPRGRTVLDRKSTRLNSSHLVISYAVFCLKTHKQHHPTATLDIH